MLGSGVFFTPGELAPVAQAPWQVYFLWTLCGLITLCGALTLAELTTLLPRAGASYHIIREGFGPFWAFLKIWIEMWVSGPGSVAGVAIIFGEFAVRLFGSELSVPRRPSGEPWRSWASPPSTCKGIQWGGRTQVALTLVKLAGLFLLVGGSLLFAAPAAPAAGPAEGTRGHPSRLHSAGGAGSGGRPLHLRRLGGRDPRRGRGIRAPQDPAGRPGAGRTGRDSPLPDRQLRVPAHRSHRSDARGPDRCGLGRGLGHLRAGGRTVPDRRS